MHQKINSMESDRTDRYSNMKRVFRILQQKTSPEKWIQISCNIHLFTNVCNRDLKWKKDPALSQWAPDSVHQKLVVQQSCKQPPATFAAEEPLLLNHLEGTTASRKPLSQVREPQPKTPMLCKLAFPSEVRKGISSLRSLPQPDNSGCWKGGRTEQE